LILQIAVTDDAATALHGCHLRRVAQGAFSAWPTIRSERPADDGWFSILFRP